MKRFFVQLAYNGSKFHGWQVQPNAITVQEVLEKALSVLLKEKVEVVGAGRTDTGVHASFFVAHFDFDGDSLEPTKLKDKLNNFLGNDIVIDTLFEAPIDLHARFSATYRTYRYFISSKKQPFRNDFTAFLPYVFSVDNMNIAATMLLSYTDFTSFSKLHTDVKTNNCKVTKAEWITVGDSLVFEITADRFLRNMVRAIVGTLLDVGRGKVSFDGFKEIIESKNRGVAGASVPAKGLFLTDIGYPEPINSQLLRKKLPGFDV